MACIHNEETIYKCMRDLLDHMLVDETSAHIESLLTSVGDELGIMSITFGYYKGRFSYAIHYSDNQSHTMTELVCT